MRRVWWGSGSPWLRCSVPLESYGSGTQTATVGTEHTLSSGSAAGTYQLKLLTSNMASGDTLELRAYSKVLTGETATVAYYVMYTGPQATNDIMKISVPISTDLAETDGVKFTLKQTTGTGRAYAWKVLRFY